MVERCRDFGYDLARAPVEVGPTTHFMMGGIAIDSACHTDLEGLFAAGEDTGGVHGANRLGGNGVAESTVFGGIAGDVMADWVAGRPRLRVSRSAVDAAARRVLAPLERGRRARLRSAGAAPRRDVGPRRPDPERRGTEDRARRDRGDRPARGGGGGAGGQEYNLAWQDWLNLRNQATAAWLIARSALERAESRGSHHRSDLPTPAPNLYNVYVRAEDKAGPGCGRNRCA